MQQKTAPNSPAEVGAAKKNDGLILLSLIAALGAIFWVTTNRPIGVAGEWTWPTRIITGARFWTALAAIALLIATAGWLTRVKRWEKTSRRGRACWLVWLVLLAWLLALGLLLMPENPVIVAGGIIAGPQTTSYFSAAVFIGNLKIALQDFTRHMQLLPQHARTHPPGPIVFFWGIDRLMTAWPGLESAVEWVCLRVDREGTPLLTGLIRQELHFPFTKTNSLAAVLSAALLPLFGSLFLLPLYQLGSRLYGPTTGMRACLLATVIPAFLLFAPAIDQLVLLFAVLVVWSFPLLLARGNPLIGLLFALGMFISFGLAILPLFLLLWWLIDRRSENQLPSLTLGKLSGRILAAALVFCAFYLLLWLLFKFNFPAVVKTGLAMHREITLHEAGRTYWKWVLYNPIEFAFFLGFPLALWTLAGLRGGLAWGWLLTLGLLNFSGSVLGETGRIWLFLMPPAALIAAARLGQLGKRFDFGFFTVLVLQLGQALVMKAGLDLFIIK